MTNIYDDFKMHGRHGQLPTSLLPDGVYRVERGSICGGFVIEGGVIKSCAPVLRKRLAYWRQFAKLVDQPQVKRRRRR